DIERRAMQRTDQAHAPQPPFVHPRECMGADVVEREDSVSRVADQHLPPGHGDTAHAPLRQLGESQRGVEIRIGHGSSFSWISPVLPYSIAPLSKQTGMTVSFSPPLVLRYRSTAGGSACPRSPSLPG